MSREIKFRVWSKDQKTYDYKFPYNSTGDFYVSTRGKVFSDFGNTIVPEVRQEAFVIEQYTGLMDKNGKEICEGDIICPSDDKAIIKWGYPLDGITAAFYIHWLNPYLADSELASEFAGTYQVIGNIHENPELLEN